MSPVFAVSQPAQAELYLLSQPPDCFFLKFIIRVFFLIFFGHIFLLRFFVLLHFTFLSFGIFLPMVSIVRGAAVFAVVPQSHVFAFFFFHLSVKHPF